MRPDAVELGWVLRPDLAGPLAGHAGKRIHSVGRTAGGDRVEVVLADGERVRAARHELVSE